MMWKVFALTVLATATAFPGNYIYADLLRHQIDQIRNYTHNTRVEKECEKYGPTGAFSNLQQSIGNAVSKLTTTFASEVARDLENKTISNYVEIACRTLTNPDVKRQVETVVTNGIQCVDPKLVEYIKESTKSDFEITEYACKNNGKRIINFVQNGGLECMKTRESILKQCIDKLSKAELGDVKDSEDIKNISRYFKIVKKCTMQELRKCSGNPAAEFVEGILNLKIVHFASKAK